MKEQAAQIFWGESYVNENKAMGRKMRMAKKIQEVDVISNGESKKGRSLRVFKVYSMHSFEGHFKRVRLDFVLW